MSIEKIKIEQCEEHAKKRVLCIADEASLADSSPLIRKRFGIHWESVAILGPSTRIGHCLGKSSEMLDLCLLKSAKSGIYRIQSPTKIWHNSREGSKSRRIPPRPESSLNSHIKSRIP
jgi:hypothetical protein